MQNFCGQYPAGIKTLTGGPGIKDNLDHFQCRPSSVSELALAVLTSMPTLYTSFLDVCSCDASLVEIYGVDCGQGVEQGVAGGVVSPVTHVQATNEAYEPPLAVLICHVALGPGEALSAGLSCPGLRRRNSSSLFLVHARFP